MNWLVITPDDTGGFKTVSRLNKRKFIQAGVAGQMPLQDKGLLFIANGGDIRVGHDNAEVFNFIVNKFS